MIVLQAIKLNPTDAETYYQRAAMFKMVNLWYYHCYSTDMVNLSLYRNASLLLTVFPSSDVTQAEQQPDRHKT